MGLVDYGSDDESSSSSVGTTPKRQQNGGDSTTASRKDDKGKEEKGRSSVITTRATGERTKETVAVSSSLTERTTEDFKLPSKLVEPKQLNNDKSNPEAQVPSEEPTLETNNGQQRTPEPEPIPLPKPRITLEEIRMKRNRLLVPETWPDCPAWVLPPEPTGEVDEEVQAKVANYHAALHNQGVQFNERLQANRGFRNPHIYDKLVEFLGLDQLGTNFPKEWFNPNGFPRDAYAHRLREAQNAAASASANQPRSSLTFVPPTTTNATEIASSAIKRVMSKVDTSTTNNHDESSSRRRKTKWDLPPES